ncbi:BLUF domain-containing protein [Acinetobacter sp. Ver3]|uniref:BLUF domain-containing protein n=1 Tax=Acinetobacter sp. Ver3 TaxID=466088 RepID=UPI00044A5383|nr:BLUF domain-containing protein [Acinetobacter sp. Ver3]EZQ06715.1 blue light sensor protein [Acinetobacter sp. Ver3]
MQQFSYASVSTADASRLLIDVREILTEARHFNFEHQISGALYYADGHYFQCLEGDQATLDILLQKLHKDNRHHQIRLFQRKNIEKKQFQEWSMKFVGRQSPVKQALIDMGFSQFTPTQFTQDQADYLIRFLTRAQDTDFNELQRNAV